MRAGIRGHQSSNSSSLMLSLSFSLLRKIENRRLFPFATTITSIYLPTSVSYSIFSPVTKMNLTVSGKEQFFSLCTRTHLFSSTQGHCSSNSPLSLSALTNSLSTGSFPSDYKHVIIQSNKQNKTLFILLLSLATTPFYSEISIFLDPLKHSVLNLLDLSATLGGQSLLSS